MEVKGMNHEERVTKLEQEIVELKIGQEVNKRDILEVKQSVNEIKKNTSKLVWLVGSALILTLLNSLIKGGIRL
jgi:archaellum component FlaC